MSEKRKCIFTGEEADWLLQIGNDKHNWAKKVPCTKEWYNSNKNRPLTPKEFRLVELFFEVEVARLKSSNFAALQERARVDEGMDELVAQSEDIDLYNALEKERRVKKELLAGILSKPDITFNEEMNKFMHEKVVHQALGSKPITIDEPEEAIPPEILEEIMTKPLIPEKAEVVLLSTPKKDDKIVKKVVKKKPTLWD